MQNVILAAGLGKRSGGEKLFYPWDGKDIIHHSVRVSLEAGLRTVVVTGCQRDRVEASLADLACPALTLTNNPAYTDGQFSSTQAGTRILRTDEDFFVTVGDLPLIQACHYRTLSEHLDGYNGVRPFYKTTKPGHPVLLRSFFIPLILKAEEGETMHHLLSRPDILPYATDDPAFVTDIDTAQAYAQLIRR